MRLLGCALVLLGSACAPAPRTAPAATARAAERWDACAANEDCGAAFAIAGLEGVPADPERALCGTRCFVAIARTRRADWDALRARLGPRVPCDKKLEKCGEAPTPACFAGRCVLP
jgi:hypothetical protein